MALEKVSLLTAALSLTLNLNLQAAEIGHPAPDCKNIRAKRRQRDLIDQAAELLGKTRSDFMLETACREAEDVLLDQRVFTLDAESFKKLQAILDAPPKENPRLRQLMATKAPWEL